MQEHRQQTWASGFLSADLLIILELMEDVMTIDPLCLLSFHSLCQGWSGNLLQWVKIRTILCSCSGSVEYAKHVDVVDVFKIFIGEVKKWFRHRDPCILHTQKFLQNEGRGEKWSILTAITPTTGPSPESLIFLKVSLTRSVSETSHLYAYRKYNNTTRDQYGWIFTLASIPNSSPTFLVTSSASFELLQTEHRQRMKRKKNERTHYL